jgi:hypothetical protein
MAYRVFWHVPDQILYLEVEGNLTLGDFDQINRAIIDLVGTEITERQLALLIDITRPASTPRDFNYLRASQTYLLRPDLKFIMVAGSNKLMRLMMLLVFNLCSPSLRFFDSVDQALKIAQVMSKSRANYQTLLPDSTLSGVGTAQDAREEHNRPDKKDTAASPRPA